jgi:hypothetical protein
MASMSMTAMKRIVAAIGLIIARSIGVVVALLSGSAEKYV